MGSITCVSPAVVNPNIRQNCVGRNENRLSTGVGGPIPRRNLRHLAGAAPAAGGSETHNPQDQPSPTRNGTTSTRNPFSGG